jgi:creatinine amidohydrolase
VPIIIAEQLTAAEFAASVDAETVAILPVAAIEPHGPHLPLSTDCDIARGHLAALPGIAGPAMALVLPLQMIGYSAEHAGQPGVFSHEPETLLAMWMDVVRPFHAAGGRRLIVVSSHGGNSETVGLLVTRLRTQLGMLAVSASWLRFGQPEGLFEPAELAYGIHGGAIETSLMLHYRPDLVRMERAADLVSAGAQWDAETVALKVHGRIRPGWRTTDLNPAGAVGNAAAATAGKGALSAAHALRGFAGLIAEVAGFDLGRFEVSP